MRIAIIALFTAAALAVPAMAQDQNANPNSPNNQATESQMGNEGQMGEMGGKVQLSRSEIKQIQQELKSKGFHSGPADGILGQETKAALERFQKENGLKPTGEPTQKTLAALGIKQGQNAMENQAQNPSTSMQNQRAAKAGQPMNQEQEGQPQNQNQNDNPENQPNPNSDMDKQK